MSRKIEYLGGFQAPVLPCTGCGQMMPFDIEAGCHSLECGKCLTEHLLFIRKTKRKHWRVEVTRIEE